MLCNNVEMLRFRNIIFVMSDHWMVISEGLGIGLWRKRRRESIEGKLGVS